MLEILISHIDMVIFDLVIFSMDVFGGLSGHKGLIGFLKMSHTVFYSLAKNCILGCLLDAFLNFPTDIAILYKYLPGKRMTIGVDALHHLASYLGCIGEMDAQSA